MTDAADILVRATQRFSASPERVFDAWFDPDLLGQWMFGPRLREEEILHLKTDARVGGRFSFLVRRQGAEIDHVGGYREIERPRRIVFTWGIAGVSVDESVVEIDIAPDGAGCVLTLTHRIPAPWAEYADRTRDGWTTMLKALEPVLSQK